MNAQTMKNGPIVREITAHRPGFRRQLVTALIVFGTISAVLLVAYFLFLPKRESFVLEHYTWSELKRQDVQETVAGSGTIGLTSTADIISPEAGYVQEVFYSAGETVDQGSLLMRISPQGLQESLEELALSLARQTRNFEMLRKLREVDLRSEEMRLASARKDKEDAGQTLESIRKMKSSGFATPAQVNDAQKAADRAAMAENELAASMESSALRFQYAEADAESEIEQVQGRMAKLRDRIDACSIRSPVKGRLMELRATKGAPVSLFSPLAVIGDYRKPVLDLKVTAGISPRIVVGQPVAITTTDQDKTYRGTVQEKALMVEQVGGSGQQMVGVRVAFIDIPEGYVLGAPASAEIGIGQKPRTLTLPRGPFLTTGGGVVLYRIQGNKAYRAEASIGIVTNTVVEILQGAEEGERIIISSYQDFMTFKEITLAAEGGQSSDSP